MGTVVINGKKYDAVTGLPLEDNGNDFSDLTSSKNDALDSIEQAKLAAERRAILGNCVADNRSEVTTPGGIKSRVQQAAQTIRARANQCQAPAWISNYMSGAAPREIEPISEREAEFRAMLRNRRPIGIKRVPGASQTLNRRYVRRPSSQQPDKVYAAPLAIDQYRKSKAMRKMFDSKVPSPRVKPVLAPRQIEALKRRANQATTAAAAAPIVGSEVKQAVPVRASNTAAPMVGGKSLSGITPRRTPESTKSAGDKVQTSHVNKVEQISDQIANVLINADQAKAKADATRQPQKHSLLDVAKREASQSKRKATAKRSKMRLPALAMVTATCALALGYVSYLVYPSIQLRLAASQAEINFKLPHTVTGYHVVNSRSDSKGKLAISYQGENSARYSLQQEKSQISDQELRGQAEEKGKNSFDLIESQGVKIYRYQDKASWIKNGVLYTLNTNDYLNKDQITKIAVSL